MKEELLRGDGWRAVLFRASRFEIRGLNGSRVNLGSFKIHPAAALFRNRLNSPSIYIYKNGRTTAPDLIRGDTFEREGF